MATHPHPEIEERLKVVVEDLETRMTEKFDHLEGKINDVLEDVRAIRAYLIPPNS